MVFAATKQVCQCSQPPTMVSFERVRACAGQLCKDILGHIFRQVRIALEHPDCRIDQTEIPLTRQAALTLLDAK